MVITHAYCGNTALRNVNTSFMISRVRGGIFARVGNFAIGGFCSPDENLAMQGISPETIS